MKRGLWRPIAPSCTRTRKRSHYLFLRTSNASYYFPVLRQFLKAKAKVKVEVKQAVTTSVSGRLYAVGRVGSTLGYHVKREPNTPRKAEPTNLWGPWLGLLSSPAASCKQHKPEVDSLLTCYLFSSYLSLGIYSRLDPGPPSRLLPQLRPRLGLPCLAT